MKDIKEPFTFYHLYVGCDLQTPDGIGKNLGLYYSPEVNDFNGVNVLYPEGKIYVLNFNQVKPILRNLSDMTEGEEEQWFDSSNDVIKDVNSDLRREAKRTIHLLSKHFDLFNLIMAGRAIEQGNN